MPQPRSANPDDWFSKQEPKLSGDGWLIYDNDRNFMRIRGFTPTVVSGNPAQQRKRNRPFYLTLSRTTEDPRDPWTGNLRLGTTSVQNPWAVGFAPPFGTITDSEGNLIPNIPEAAWNTSYAQATADSELNQARDNPRVTFTNSYTNLWLMDPNFPTDPFSGQANTQAQYDACVHMFAQITVPNGTP